MVRVPSPALTEEVKRRGEMGMTADLQEKSETGAHFYKGDGEPHQHLGVESEARGSHGRTKVQYLSRRKGVTG
jgi:hypothetical protein